MTRRGSLAYYLAAWVCGCFFMSAAMWLKDLARPGMDFSSIRSASGLLSFYFLGLMFGAASALLGGFLLRRIARMGRWTKAWQWVATGAAVAPAMIAVLGSIWRSASRNPWPGGWFVLIFYGPAVVLHEGWWLAIPAGGVTAWVLHRIHSAFGTKPGAGRLAPPEAS